MSKFVGTFLAILTLGVIVFIVLWIWGVIDPNLWTIGKVILTGGIILGGAVALTVIYGMFFWKGLKAEPKPGEKKTAGSEFIGNRYSDR